MIDPDALPTPNCLQFLLPSQEGPASPLLLRPCLLPREWLTSLTDRFKVTLSPGSFPPGTGWVLQAAGERIGVQEVHQGLLDGSAPIAGQGRAGQGAEEAELPHSLSAGLSPPV